MTDQWWQRAACKDANPVIFFQDSLGGNAWKPAKEYCARCPVTTQCLNDALQYDMQFGMWGGKTANERKLAGDPVKYLAKQQIGHGDARGTTTGYWREKSAGMEPCDDCRHANSQYRSEKRRQSKGKQCAS